MMAYRNDPEASLVSNSDFTKAMKVIKPSVDHEEDYITKLYKMAEESGATVEIIGDESDEGSTLKKA